MKKTLQILIIILGLSFVAAEGVYAEPQTKGTAARARKQPAKTNAANASASGNKKQSPASAGGPKTSAEAQKQQAAAQKEVKATEAQIRQNEAKVSKSLADLGKLDQEIEVTSGKIKELNTIIASLNTEIKGLESNISKNEKELARLREEYLKAVKKMRVSKKKTSTLAFIFSSNSMSQALRRMRYLREFSTWREKQTEEINGKIADLKNQKDALAKAREEQKTALALQKTNETQLNQQHQRQEVLIAELKQNGEALESHLRKKQAEARELGNKVSQLIAAEQQKAAEEQARKRAQEEAQLRAQEEAKRKAEEEARRKAEEEKRKNDELLAQEKNTVKETPKPTPKPEAPKKEAPKKEEPKKEPPKKEEPKKETPKKESTPKKDSSSGSGSSDYADARKRAPRGQSATVGNVTKPTVVENTPAPASGNFQDMRGRLSYPTTGSFLITSRFGRQNLPDLPGVEFDNPGIDAETDAGASARAVFKGKVSGVYLLPGYNTVVIVNHGNYYTVYGNIAKPSVKVGDNVDNGTKLGTLALNEDDSRHASIHFEVWRNREKLNPQDWLK